MKKKEMEDQTQNIGLVQAISMLAEEKGLDEEVLYEAVESALISGYQKLNLAKGFEGKNAVVRLDRITGEAHVYEELVVVDDVEELPEEERKRSISLDDAWLIDTDLQIGDVVRKEVTPANFGRVAALNAKSVISQKIREAEKASVITKFKDKTGNMVTGVVKRIEQNVVFIDIDGTECMMHKTEWVNGENYKIGEELNVYIISVKADAKGSAVKVSRKDPDLVKRLFEREVPEIAQGTVIIKSIAREAGSRTKVSVFSYDDGLDALGSCVGAKGERVRNIVKELGGEKIDIVKWDADPVEYIKHALSPSSIVKVILNPDDGTAIAVVPDDQLSLAIGKSGQNVRLAVHLTGWKIDIKSESQFNTMPLDSATIKELMRTFNND